MITIKSKHFKYLVALVIIIYIACYYVASSGYYEYHVQEKTLLTNQKIKEFEDDVKNNREIDIKDYLTYEEVDYTSKLTDLMYGISDHGNKIARKIIKGLFKRLSYLIED